MAGNLTGSELLNFLDFSIAYFVVVLGQCVKISFFLFLLVLLLRRTLLEKTVFLKGMSWGIFFTAPFLGKLKLFYEADLFSRRMIWWEILCTECWWARHGYLLGMAICAGFLFFGRRRLCRFVKYMEQDRICGQKVWINELAATPFSTGLFHPKIILPDRIRKNLDTEEIETILLHERTHIRLGHLWFYLWWDILQILLWPNFLFIVCRQCFQEDLEAVCDRITIQKSGRSACSYGLLLLKNMELLSAKASVYEKGKAAFVETRDYRNVKRRISRIADFTPYKKSVVCALCIGGAVILAGMFLLIRHYSYPRYTEKRTAILSQEVTYTSAVVLEGESFEQALSWDKEYAYIYRTAMDQILEQYGIEGDRFYIYVGGYTKIPQMGSGGGCVYVDYRGQEEELRIPYWNSEKNFWSTLLKQMP